MKFDQPFAEYTLLWAIFYRCPFLKVFGSQNGFNRPSVKWPTQPQKKKTLLVIGRPAFFGGYMYRTLDTLLNGHPLVWTNHAGQDWSPDHLEHLHHRMVRPPPPAARPASGFSGFHFQTCWKIRSQKGLWNLLQWCNHPSIHKNISRLDLFDFMMSSIHMGSRFSTYGMGGSNGMGDRLHSTESLMDGVRKLNDQPQPRTPTRAARSLETCLISKCPMKHVRAIQFLPS